LRLVQGAVTGVITASNALVATTAPRERAGYALGLLQMAVYVGASLGPLLGGVVSDQWGFRAAFWVTGALLLLAGLGVLLFVRERFEPAASALDDPSAAHQTLGARLRNYVAPVLGSAPLLVVLGMRMLTRLGARLTGPVLPLFVESIAPPGTAVASLTGVISGANAAAGAVGALWLGPLGDRVGSRKILVLCTAAAALCYVPQFFATTPSWLVLLQGVAGLTMGGVLASLSAELARLSQKGQEGIVYGLAGSAMAIANAIGPMLGSVTAAYLGLPTPFLVAAALFALTSAAAARLLPETRT
jgi:DHA1 family multidrug resistance protein-like MFS transporter